MATESGRRATVIGVGLIGGSIAAGLRARGWRVAGHDPDGGTADRARSLGLVDDIVDDLSVEGSDLVVVAAPPKATIEVLASIHTDSVVMDVAGIKRAIVDVTRHLPSFVGTHPMAGRETAGPDAASPALFHGAAWVVVPGSDTATRQVVGVIEDLGAQPVMMTADQHDRSVAFVSHLPQLLASVLLSAASDDDASLSLAAGSFRDLTRVGASEPLPWVEILKANDAAVREAITALRAHLDRVEAAIDADDDTLLTLLSAARDTRRALGSPVAQVRIALADRPGELAKVGHAIEASGTDIRDLQMRHAPHGGGGVLTLSVRPGEAGSLAHALEDEGLLLIP